MNIVLGQLIDGKGEFTFRSEPGWLGSFTRHQSQGAFLNGSRAEKINTEPLDSHLDGAVCTILGSISRNGITVYFVEWDDMPRIASSIAGHRLKPCQLTPKKEFPHDDPNEAGK